VAVQLLTPAFDTSRGAWQIARSPSFSSPGEGERMTPVIRIVHGCDGARNAEGLVVVIDVLRAFSTACYLAAGGAWPIVAVAGADEALQLRRRNPGTVLLGERDGLKIPGFDLGNSPSQVLARELDGRGVVLTTSNGTRGLAAANRADEVITGSFVNAGAIVGHIRRQAPGLVSLVCMGSDRRPVVEDTLCALYLSARIKGTSIDFRMLKRTIMGGGSVARFLASRSPDMPPEDPSRCLVMDRFQFVLKVENRPGPGIELKPVEISPHPSASG
jgi:2-phosphosulfolactate phosphatase